VRDLDGDRVEGDFYSLPQEVGISSSRNVNDRFGRHRLSSPNVNIFQ